MLKYKRFLAYALTAALLFSGCSATDNLDNSSVSASQINSTPASSSASVQETNITVSAPSDKVKNEDLDASWDESSAAKIILNGDSIEVNGSGVSASGSTATINSAGTYIVSGTLADGQIVINAPEAALVRLVLNNADISNSTTSPIYCEQADKLVLILADGTANTVTDSETYVFPDADTDEPNATIFSNADTTVNGTGTLTVNANYNNGIGTKDDLIIVSGTFNVIAANNAIRGRDSVTVLDGKFALNSGNDGIQSNNDTVEDKGWIELYGGSFDITAAHDGIQAGTFVTVEDGEYKITTSGGSVNAPQRAAESRGGRGGGGMPPTQSGERPERQMPAGAGITGGWTATPPGTNGAMPAPPGTGGETTAPLENNGASSTASDTTTDNTETDITSETDAVSDSFKAIKASTNLTITGGSFVIDSADDALHANGNTTVSGGSFTISTGDDAMHADSELVISGNPKIDILTSYEGLEGAIVTVSGGDIGIVATDDGVNAAGGVGGGEGGTFGQDRFNSGDAGKYRISIEGGTISVTAGTDGLDSNGDLLISGGTISFSMTNLNAIGGDGMLDKDGSFSITGGTITGAGGNGVVTMGRATGEATSIQPILQLFYSNVQTAGTLIEIKDAGENTIASFTPEQDFSCIIVSVSEFELEKSYSVYAGGEKTLDFTLSDLTTSLRDTGEAVTGMGMGGRGGAPAAP